MMKKKRDMNYNKLGLAYDVESYKHNFTATFEEIRTDKKYFYLGGVTNIPLGTRFDGSVQIANLYELRRLVMKHLLIGFNNKWYDDYIIQAMLDGKSAEEVNELSVRIIESPIPAYRFEDKPKAVFGTFDILSVINKKDVSLKQLAAMMGLPVKETEIDFNLKRPLTPEELVSTLKYNTIDTTVTKHVFLNPVIFGGFTQHKAMINIYLPGKDWAISQSDADLAVRALTDNGRLKVEMKEKFDWMLNGHYVLDFIPEQWKNALLNYAKDVEAGVQKYKAAVSSGEMTGREAGREYMKSIPRPAIEPIKMSESFVYMPSIGGAHSKFVDENGNQTLARFNNVHHRDIQGAYGALALMTNLFGEATPVYAGFMEDKFNGKKLRSFVKDAKKANQTPVEIIRQVNDQFNASIPLNSGMKDIDDLVEERVGSTKLATNSPTGKSDEPGSSIYNPITITENRIMLQVTLYLAARLVIENGGHVLSVNTDGLFYIGDDSVLAPYFDQWAKFWNLGLDYDHVDTYIAKDDNSRVLVVNGEITEATGDVSHREFNPKKLGALPRIVDVAVVEKLVNPEREISDIVSDLAKENRVDLFAWVLKPTKLHKTVVDFEITQKINRILMTTEGSKIGNYSITKDKIEAMRYLPDDAYVTIINGDMPTTIPENIDLEQYVGIVERSYSNWDI